MVMRVDDGQSGDTSRLSNPSIQPSSGLLAVPYATAVACLNLLGSASSTGQHRAAPGSTGQVSGGDARPGGCCSTATGRQA
jgi:hypothetical protein